MYQSAEEEKKKTKTKNKNVVSKHNRTKYDESVDENNITGQHDIANFDLILLSLILPGGEEWFTLYNIFPSEKKSLVTVVKVLLHWSNHHRPFGYFNWKSLLYTVVYVLYSTHLDESYFYNSFEVIELFSKEKHVNLI